MKTAKIVMGVISLVLTGLVLFQSCAAAVVGAVEEESQSGGGAGVLVALCMLIGGILAIATRKSKGGAVVCTVVYGLAGLVGWTMHGIYADLQIWGGMCLVFAVLFLWSALTWKKPSTVPQTKETEEKKEETNI